MAFKNIVVYMITNCRNAHSHSVAKSLLYCDSFQCSFFVTVMFLFELFLFLIQLSRISGLTLYTNPSIILADNCSLSGRLLEIPHFSNWQEGILKDHYKFNASCICVTEGLWLLYERDLLSGKAEAAYGNNFCFEPYIKPYIKSIRFVEINPNTSSNITTDKLFVIRRRTITSVFWGSFFQSEDVLLVQDLKQFPSLRYPNFPVPYAFLMHVIEEYSDFVTIGSSSWTLYTDKDFEGNSLCLMGASRNINDNNNKSHSLLLAYVNNMADFEIRSVRRGCYGKNKLQLHTDVHLKKKIDSNKKEIQGYDQEMEVVSPVGVTSEAKDNNIDDIDHLESLEIERREEKYHSYPLWLKKLLNALFSISTASCIIDHGKEDNYEELIPKYYILNIKILYSHYFTSTSTNKEYIEDSGGKAWENMTNSLINCFYTEKLAILKKDMLQKYDPISQSYYLNNNFFPPREKVEFLYDLDPIVDTFWWVTTHAFSLCSSYISKTELEYMKLLQKFYKTFLTPFIHLWTNPDQSKVDYKKILNGFDTTAIIPTIKLCSEVAIPNSNVTRSFDFEGRLLRPINYSFNNVTYKNGFI